MNSTIPSLVIENFGKSQVINSVMCELPILFHKKLFKNCSSFKTNRTHIFSKIQLDVGKSLKSHAMWLAEVSKEEDRPSCFPRPANREPGPQRDQCTVGNGSHTPLEMAARAMTFQIAH